MSYFKLHLYLLLKLPSAFLTGVRVKTINKKSCETSVSLSWINQNPFKSMFWAIQGMAAELSTGLLIMNKIKSSGHNISMLVLNNKASFYKKGKGKLRFSCDQGNEIDHVIQSTIETGEGQTVTLTSKGINTDQVCVSKFEFEWTLKLR